jgi:hypothetical protein
VVLLQRPLSAQGLALDPSWGVLMARKRLDTVVDIK